jgi:hypothetical protein
MEAKQLVQVHDVSKPLSRLEISKSLITVDSSKGNLTILEQEQLDWFKEEFWYELKTLGQDVSNINERWNLYTLRTKGLDLSLNAVLGGVARFNEGGSFTYRYSNGLAFFGYFKDIIGFYFNFRDNREQGDRVDYTRALTPDQGFVLSKGGFPANYVEYDEFDGHLSLDLGPVQIEAGKDLNVWGHGYRGQLILSTKAPSYPELKLKVRLTDWLDFAYIHAWLFSGIMDSNLSYRIRGGGVDFGYRTVYRDKFLASHILEATIIPGLDVSVGESIVYSDKTPQLIYLIPIMFFRSADHYNRSQDNSQFFADVKADLIRNVGLYGTLFIDELSLESIFGAEGTSTNQIGYQVGALLTNLVADNFDLRAEYTKIRPWVYSNYIPVNSYENNGFVLGSWIGQNADDLYLEANYTLLRSLKFSAYFERFRKAGITYPYTLPVLHFLYGPERRESDFGFKVRFEPTRDLFATLSACFSNVSDEATSVENVKDTQVVFSLRYNLFY